MVIYILTKFGDDWLIFVGARVLTSKLWTDGRTTRRQTPTDGEWSQQLNEHSVLMWAKNAAFSPFPKMFSSIYKTNLNLLKFILSSARTLNMDKSKIQSFGKELLKLDQQKYKLGWLSQNENRSIISN